MSHCPGCTKHYGPFPSCPGCGHEAELARLATCEQLIGYAPTMSCCQDALEHLGHLTARSERLTAAEAERADRRQQVAALLQLLDEITVASGAGIVCRPIDLPSFIRNMIRNMKAELAALRAALVVAKEMAAWLHHRSEGQVHDILIRFEAARETVGK